MEELVLENRSRPTYESDNYSELHNLATNRELHPVPDNNASAQIAAFIFNVVDQNTSYFTDFLGKWFFVAVKQDYLIEYLLGEEKRNIFKALLQHHVCIERANSRSIVEILQTGNLKKSQALEIASGVYSFTSLFNHSCCPNVQTVHYNDIIVLQTVRPIKKGQQLFVNYK